MAGVMVTRQLVNHNVGQRDNITPPSTGRHQHRSTSSADNIYRHLPVLHHRHLWLYIYYVRHHLLVHHLRHSFLRIRLLTRITHMDYLHGLHLHYLGPNSTTADYPRLRTTNYNIVRHCITCPWPYSSCELWTVNVASYITFIPRFPLPKPRHLATARASDSSHPRLWARYKFHICMYV